MLWMPMLRMRMLLTAGAPAPGIKSIKCIKCIKRIEASPFRPKSGPEMAHLTHLMLLMLLMGVPPPLLWMPMLRVLLTAMLRVLLTAGERRAGIKSASNVSKHRPKNRPEMAHDKCF